MGRDGVLPRRLFAHLDSRTSTPTFNIALLGLLSFAGAMVTDYETAGEVLNFGAFLGFMGVNLAAFRQFYLLSREGHLRSFLRDALVPLLGFLFCLAIWIGLSPISKKLGGAWFLVGITYLVIQTRGLRLKPAMIDFSESPS
jgi:hypothetical protein